jgi:PAS domain S-box-containing protein
VSFFRRLKFQSKINLGITAVVVFFGLISAVLVSRVAVNSLITENKDQGSSLALNLANRAVDPMLAQDFLRLKNLVHEITELSDYNTYAFILDRESRVMVHTFKEGFPVNLRNANTVTTENKVNIQLIDTGKRRIYDFAAPILVAGDRVGTVRIGVSRAQVQSTVDRVLTTIVLITAGIAVISALLGSLFARNVAARINALRDSAHEVVKGNLDVSTAPPLTRNCWEIMDCRNEDCPAYGDTRRRCWFHVGTLCPGCEGKKLHQKFQSCLDCTVYKLSAGDEITRLAETFDFMALILKEHIQELQETRDDLIRQQQLMKTMLDVTPDLVSLQDENLAYKAVNRAFLNFFHLNEENVIGKADFEIFPEQVADRTYHEDKQILITGKHLSKQVLIGRENNKRWFHVLKVPVYSEGKIIGLLLTARDISVIKQYQEQLIQSQKMQDLGKLAGGVAHEINTPLGIILGYVQLLLEDAPKDQQIHQDLQTIEKQTKVCRKIVSDLLGFSRNTESAMESMDLNASIEEIVSVVEHIFRQERVMLEKDLDPTIPPIIGDKEKLKQVWMNLLNNAFDAVGSDGTILVATKLCSHRRRVVVSVSDTGKGISQENLNHIFDPFFTTKPAGEGTGLGLSVTFGIIHDHKGRISAISPAPMEYMPQQDDKEHTEPPGPGTVFFIELPLTKEGLPDEECPEISAYKVEGKVSLPSAAYEEEGGITWQK